MNNKEVYPCGKYIRYIDEEDEVTVIFPCKVEHIKFCDENKIPLDKIISAGSYVVDGKRCVTPLGSLSLKKEPIEDDYEMVMACLKKAKENQK
jgi:hypothetical protein